MKLPISLVIVTLNEEKNIERCLRSVLWAQDIVVLDSGSQDRTCEIAKSLGARVFSEPWKGFGPQKRRAVELANQDWILSLDADEVLSIEASHELQEKFKTMDSKKGYFFPRKSFYLGRWILHGGWYPDYQLRLFNRKQSNWDKADIHEKVQVQVKEKLKNPIEHYVFKDLADQVETNNRYSSLQAKQHFTKGESFSLFRLLIKPFSKFIECYFLKKGIMDGLPGLIIAVGAGYSVFIRWAKVWELEREQKK